MTDSARWNWRLWWRRASTVLAAIATGAQAAGVFFIAAPPEWKGSFPATFGFVMLGAGMVASALIPLATSFNQPAHSRDA